MNKIHAILIMIVKRFLILFKNFLFFKKSEKGQDNPLAKSH